MSTDSTAPLDESVPNQIQRRIEGLQADAEWRRTEADELRRRAATLDVEAAACDNAAKEWRDLLARAAAAV